MHSKYVPSEKSIALFAIESYDSVHELPKDVWSRLTQNIFYSSTEHLAILEKVQKENILFYYVLVRKSTEYVAAFYFQYLNFSMDNAINSWRNKNEAKCSVLYPLLWMAKGMNLPLLQSGNVFITEDNGWFFSPELCDTDKINIVNEVTSHLTYVIPSRKSTYFMLSGWESAAQAGSLTLEGYHPLETEPNLVLNIPLTWNTFDDYVSRMSSKYRQRVRKVMQASCGLEIKNMSLDEIIDSEEVLLELYANVAQKASFNMAWLSKGYFSEYKKLYGEGFDVKGYWHNGDLVGFTSSFCTTQEQYVHFIGIDYSVNEQIPLYHRMLFEFVRESISQRHKKVFLGRTATEIKTTIGAQPVSMTNFIKVQKSLYKCVLPKVLMKFGAKPYIVRSPFKQLDEMTVEV